METEDFNKTTKSSWLGDKYTILTICKHTPRNLITSTFSEIIASYKFYNRVIHYKKFYTCVGSITHFTSTVLGFSVFVSNTTDRLKGTLCFKDTSFTLQTIPAVFSTKCAVHGQYVISYNERLPGVTYPTGYSPYAYHHLCEIEVNGGYFVNTKLEMLPIFKNYESAWRKFKLKHKS